MKFNVQMICGLVLVATVSGCSLFSPQSLNVVENEQAPKLEPFPIAPHLFSPDGEFSSTNVSELRPGQKVQVLTGAQPESQDEWTVSDDILAGVVLEVTDTGLILKDVTQVTYGVSHVNSTMLSKVPYVSRLFKNTAIGATAAHIPGTVTLPRTEILATSVLTDKAYRSLSNGEPPRIGVDFDVVADAQPE